MQSIRSDPSFTQSKTLRKGVDPWDPVKDVFTSQTRLKNELKRKKERKKLHWERPICLLVERTAPLSLEEAKEKPRYFKCGLFWGNLDVPEMHVALLISVLEYFTEKRLRKDVLPFVTRKADISLRLLGWLATNYVKEHPVTYLITCKDASKRTINVLQSYHAMMKQYHRRHFDPFRRKYRIYFTIDDESYGTTIGQLLFLKWVAEEFVVDYARNFKTEIENHMLIHTDAKREEREKEEEMGITHKRSEFIKKKHRGITMFAYDFMEDYSEGEESESDEDEMQDKKR